MVVAAVVVFGLVSVQQMSVDLMPELSYPTITVRTNYPGAAPEEVEDEVVEPMEDLLRTVEGVVGVTSVSRAGGGDVLLRFQWDTQLDVATQKVRERIGLLDFPDAVEAPLILRYDPALDPVLRLAVSGDASLADMRAYAEDELQRALEKIEGVAMVRVFGGEEAIVRVSLDERRLQAFSLDVREIVERLRSENVNVAGGRLYEGEIEYLVRTVNEFRTLDDIGALVVAVRDGGVIRLRDVATVERAVRERTVVTRVDGRESIELAIFKEADANLVAVAEAVKREVFGRASWRVSDVVEAGSADPSGGDEGSAEGSGSRHAPGASDEDRGLAGEAPEGVTLALLSDQSTYVRAAIAEVVKTARNGGVFAVLVLFLFLRRPYATLVIGLSIPLSVMATFAPMRLLGVSLNVMSLGGLALGIGMLVDNAIVVLESIVRCREEGDDARAAAIRGTREVGGAVVASTLTTVAVFFPIVFVEGIAGQLFGDLAVAVVLSLIASLLFALFFVPMMAVLPERGPTDGEAVGGGWRLLAPLASWRAARADLTRLWAWVRRAWWWGPVALVSALWVIGRTAPWLALEVAVRPLLGLVFALVWLSRRATEVVNRALARLARGQSEGPAARAYGAGLGGVLKARFFVLALSVAAMAWTVGAYERLGLQLIPELEQGEFTARVRLPVGTRLEETVAVVQAIEADLGGDPAIARMSTFVGQNADDLDASEQGEHYAEITFVVADAGAHPGREAALMRRVREALARRPAVESELTRPTLFSLEAPVSVEIRGYALDALAETARRVEEEVGQRDGVADVRSNMQPGFPEIRVRFDRERLAALGLDVRQVADVVRSKVQGETATEVRPNDRSVDVEVRVQRDDLETLTELRELVVGFANASGAEPPAMPGLEGIATPGGERRAVRLDAVADISIERGPAEIRHLDGQRAAVVSASASVLDVGSVVADLDARLRTLPLARDQVLRVAGQSREMDAARQSMALALALAVFLVYVVMASKFESLVAPLVILASVPLALVGVVGMLTWWGLPVSVVTFIGAIVLAGIVVNNAIVLVDTILLLRRRGLAKDRAIIEACRMRLRPVMITATTTVLGLLPMALGLGEGAEIRRPLALVVIAGLSASTLLTLVVLPALYHVFGEALGAPTAGSQTEETGAGQPSDA